MAADDARFKQMIERAVGPAGAGFSVQSWREHDGRPEAVVGRFRVVEDDDDRGMFEGDEGVLTAGVVGGQEYGNERVALNFTPDGMDMGDEVADLDALEPVD